MVKEPGDICPHILQRVVSSVGKSWTILILVTLGNFGRLRFHELQNKLGRISPKTLSARLKEMEGAGFVSRESFAEVPPRVEYSLTPEGRDLVSALRPLIRWADRASHVR
jgi:DNA-binding HxlR family transcriptional regulator